MCTAKSQRKRNMMMNCSRCRVETFHRSLRAQAGGTRSDVACKKATAFPSQDDQLRRALAGPLRLRLSELRLQSLRRLISRAQAPQGAANQEDGDTSASLASTLDSARQGLDAASSSVRLAAQGLQAHDEQSPSYVPIMVRNFSGVDLQLGQVGTDESLRIAHGESLPYRYVTGYVMKMLCRGRID